MCRDEGPHLCQGWTSKDDVVGRGAINEEVDALNGLNEIARETHKKLDGSIKQVVRDMKFIERFCEHDTHRVTSVNKDTFDIKVRNVCLNNQRIIMGKDGDMLLFLAEDNGVLTCSRHL
ncbi:unnamed protein product [Prunus armeniaca]